MKLFLLASFVKNNTQGLKYHSNSFKNLAKPRTNPGLVITKGTCFVRLKPTPPIRFQIMYLHPSVEDCRYVILQQLFAWQAVVTSQERIQSTRYQVRPQYF
jgi:hypothetical protein